MISIIHPSRGRPAQARKVFDTILAQADSPFEYILCVDEGDPHLQAYRNAFFGLFTSSYISICIGNNTCAVEAINRGAKEAKGDILMVMSDDFELCMHWDTKIEEATRGQSGWMLKTYDGQQKWIATLPILHRDLYERLGYMYHPEYRHMFADTHLSSICDLMGVTITRLGINFIHKHYTATNAKPDAVNERANLSWNQGEALYLKHHMENYGLAPDEIKGKLKPHPGHMEWLAKALRAKR